MTVDLAAKINEFVKANRKVWPEWPKEEKPKRRNPRHRHRDQVYWVGDNTFSHDGDFKTVLLWDREVLEITGDMYLDTYDEYSLSDCWDSHYHLAGKPGEGVRLYEVTAKEARRLWKHRLCSDYNDDEC